ncbi:MAG: hypothetical protein MPW15_19065 [Candidatus Manganitrophus sp.]|nr:hypothetical protein [Candidatus Manganitrophus sp.]
MLTNIVRHAGATRVEIRIKRRRATFTLRSKTTAEGSPVKKCADPKSLGILGMRERVLLLNGEIEISGGPKKGGRMFG